MKTIISTTDIVETFQTDREEWEVCAAAVANYDESSSRVLVELESFLRKATSNGDGELRQIGWLPDKETIVEHASREEASQVARDVFESWVRKVRHSIPADPLGSSASGEPLRTEEPKDDNPIASGHGLENSRQPGV